jgi:hypothetical protein
MVTSHHAAQLMAIEPAATAALLLLLQLHSIRKFVAHNTRLRPAYFIAVDHAQQTIIWGEAYLLCQTAKLGSAGCLTMQRIPG